MTITVVNQFNEFLTESGRFVAEYPDSSQFETLTAAKRAMRLAKKSGQYSAIYYAVANYGLGDSCKVRLG